MAADLSLLIADLAGESSDLQAMLGALDEGQWSLPTPALGWDVADQVGHLAYFDEAALLSMVDPERFRQGADQARMDDNGPDRIAADHRGMPGPEVLAWFRAARSALLAGYAEVDPATRLPWYGPDMGVASSITARLMETWAHGQDIADALEVRRLPTARLRHIAYLGIKAMPYSYTTNGLTSPAEPIRVELAAPGGHGWAWGPVEAVDRVTGPALDFALVVTQRRHVSDTALTVTGSTAQQWIGIAQAFAGAPGPGRAPLSASSRSRTGNLKGV